MLIESIRMSWENIIHNKLRSFLTMLGIVIGVASIIALITIVQGASASISDQVSALGVNKIVVTAQGTTLKQGLTSQDIAEISRVDNVNGISPTVSVKSGVEAGGTVRENVTVQGKNEVFFKMDNTLIKSGRAINILDLDSANRVALIGNDVAEGLFYGTDPIGHDLIINGKTYTVIGTLKASSGFSSGSLNNTVIIPYTTALRSLNMRNISALDIYLADTSIADDTVIAIEAVLKRAFNFRENAFSVFNMGDMIASFQQIMSMMSLLLAGIAAISLVVGGIGIMNMMLVSITERTVEIGLRKALGATPGRIQLQFLIEAIFLSMIGGLIGFALGSFIAYIAATLIGIGLVLTASTIALAIGFSAGVGIAFGYAPARKASRLNPIDALRSL